MLFALIACPEGFNIKMETFFTQEITGGFASVICDDAIIELHLGENVKLNEGLLRDNQLLGKVR